MRKASRFLLFVFGIVFLIGCNPGPKNKKWPKNVYLVNNGGCVGIDTFMIQSVGNNLYTDKNSNLYFMAQDRSDETGIPKPVLISRFYNSCEGDSTYDLKYTIDVATFRQEDDFYYRDKNHRYRHNVMLDGGNLVISD